MSKFFAKQLQKLRKERGLTQAELGDKFNITKTGISYWETSKSEPAISVIKELAAFFGVGVEELIGTAESLYEIKDDSEDYFLIKCYNKTIIENIDDLQSKHSVVFVPNKFKKNRKKLIAIKINDDCMDNIFPQNSILIILKQEMHFNEILNNTPIAVIRNGEIMVRRFYIDNGDILLVPDSDKHRRSLVFKIDENVQKEFEIIGKVIYHILPDDIGDSYGGLLCRFIKK